MYKVTITDKELKIISWIDVKNNTLICSSTEDTGNVNSSPVQTGKINSSIEEIRS